MPLFWQNTPVPNILPSVYRVFQQINYIIIQKGATFYQLIVTLADSFFCQCFIYLHKKCILMYYLINIMSVYALKSAEFIRRNKYRSYKRITRNFLSRKIL